MKKKTVFQRSVWRISFRSIKVGPTTPEKKDSLKRTLISCRIKCCQQTANREEWQHVVYHNCKQNFIHEYAEKLNEPHSQAYNQNFDE